MGFCDSRLNCKSWERKEQNKILWVVVCVLVYVFSILEVGSGVDESRDCVFS